jgi:RNA polymerase sigma factor (sigma-70 family)
MRPLDARERELVAANLGLVAHLAKKYGSPRVPFEDRFQAGVVGLMQAARGFDPSLGPWGAYAAKGICFHIWRAIRRAHRAPETIDCVELDPAEVRDDPADPVLADERDERVRSALDELPERLRDVVVRHHWQGANHYVQAAERGCTRTNVWLIERKAHGLLRERLSAVAR